MGIIANNEVKKERTYYEKISTTRKNVWQGSDGR